MPVNFQKIFYSIVAGILCFLLAPYSISFDWDVITIDIPWSMLFPIIISIAYGWKYGLLTALSGGALYPFYLWINNGWANVATFVFYSLFLLFIGLTKHKRFLVFAKHQILKLGIVFVFISIILIVYYSLIFNKLLSLNPAFWNKETINYLEQHIINSFAYKDIINFLVLIITAETFLQISFIRNFLKLKNGYILKSNTYILFFTILISLLIWLIFVGLGHFLIKDSQFKVYQINNLALWVILLSGIAVARMLIIYNKKQYESQTEILKRNIEYEKLNKELEISKNKAIESDKLKTSFLNNLSHEIRTPLNGIMGFTALLKDDDKSTEKRKQYIDIIHRSGNQLLNIVNDILDFSMIETDQLELNRNTVFMQHEIQNVVYFFKEICISKNIELIFDNKLKNNSVIIELDQIKFNYILKSLVDNAIKFTSKGKISIGYDIVDKNIQFFVKDTGIGIDKQHQNKIFNKFWQVESGTTRNYGGTGLGLTITKAYIEKMGGKIWVDSELNKGTCFYFTLPYSTNFIKSEKIKLNNQQVKNKINYPIVILIVEDEFANYLLIKEYLYGDKYVVYYAENGKIAIELINKHADIDLVLMDIKMPVMDGYEALNQIKNKNSAIPVIALSAYATEADKDEINKSEFDDYLTKPVSKKQLLKTIKTIYTKLYH